MASRWRRPGAARSVGRRFRRDAVHAGRATARPRPAILVGKLRALSLGGVLSAVEHFPVTRAALPAARGRGTAASFGLPDQRCCGVHRRPVPLAHGLLVVRWVRLDTPVNL